MVSYGYLSCVDVIVGITSESDVEIKLLLTVLYVIIDRLCSMDVMIIYTAIAISPVNISSICTTIVVAMYH